MSVAKLSPNVGQTILYRDENWDNEEWGEAVVICQEDWMIQLKDLADEEFHWYNCDSDMFKFVCRKEVVEDELPMSDEEFTETELHKVSTEEGVEFDL